MLIINTAEGGTDGTVVTSGNSGGASGTAWNTVNAGTSGTTVKFSAAQKAIGGLSYMFETHGTAEAAFVTWSTPITPGLTMYARTYCYFQSSPVSIFRIFQLLDGSFLSCGGVGVSSGGKFILRNSAGTLTSTSTSSVPQNQWVRLELMVFSDASVGQMELKIFLNSQSSTPDETLTTAANVNTRGGNIAAAAFGDDVTISNLTMYQDNMAVSNTGYIGPDSVTPAMAWYTA